MKKKPLSLKNQIRGVERLLRKASICLTCASAVTIQLINCKVSVYCTGGPGPEGTHEGGAEAAGAQACYRGAQAAGEGARLCHQIPQGVANSCAASSHTVFTGDCSCTHFEVVKACKAELQGITDAHAQVRFFERVKLERRIKQLQRQLAEAAREGCMPDQAAAQQLAAAPGRPAGAPAAPQPALHRRMWGPVLWLRPQRYASPWQ